MLFIACQPSNRLSIFLLQKFLSLLNKSSFHSAQIYCYKVLKRIMNLELAVSFPVKFNEYHIWSMTNCWTLGNRGPFNPYSHGLFRSLKKNFDFDIKEAQGFFSFFNADENAFRGGFSAQQKLSIQLDNRIKRRIRCSLIFRDQNKIQSICCFQDFSSNPVSWGALASAHPAEQQLCNALLRITFMCSFTPAQF